MRIILFDIDDFPSNNSRMKIFEISIISVGFSTTCIINCFQEENNYLVMIFSRCFRLSSWINLKFSKKTKRRQKCLFLQKLWRSWLLWRIIKIIQLIEWRIFVVVRLMLFKQMVVPSTWWNKDCIHLHFSLEKCSVWNDSLDWISVVDVITMRSIADNASDFNRK